MQFLDELFVQYIGRLCSIQPGYCLDDVVLFPSIELVFGRYMSEQQPFGLVWIYGRCPFKWKRPPLQRGLFIGAPGMSCSQEVEANRGVLRIDGMTVEACATGWASTRRGSRRECVKLLHRVQRHCSGAAFRLLPEAEY